MFESNQIFIMPKIMYMIVRSLTIDIGQCPLNHFRCSNQRCVQENVVCDGKNDCGDYSDESEGCYGIILNMIIKRTFGGLH